MMKLSEWVFTREATFTKNFLYKQFLRTPGNVVGVYVRKNAGR